MKDDFVKYWAATRLSLKQENPYSGVLLYQIEKQIWPSRSEPVMMWNPPWTMSIVLPFGLLNYLDARLFWLLISISILFLCSDRLWKLFNGPVNFRWISLLSGISVNSSILVLKFGQIAPFILLGLVGFLIFMKRENYFLAGCFAFLTSVKPHLTYLFWIALAAWIIKNKAWNLLLGVVSTFTIASGLITIINLHIWVDYLISPGKWGPLFWSTPTFGTVLRLIFGAEKLWLLFIPSILGIILFIYYWIHNHKSWNWTSNILILLPISVISSSFGWSYDQFILIPLVIVIFIYFLTQNARHKLGTWIYIVLDAIGFILIIFTSNDLYFLLFPLSLFSLFLFLSSARSESISLIKTNAKSET